MGLTAPWSRRVSAPDGVLVWCDCNQNCSLPEEFSRTGIAKKSRFTSSADGLSPRGESSDGCSSRSRGGPSETLIYLPNFRPKTQICSCFVYIFQVERWPSTLENKLTPPLFELLRVERWLRVRSPPPRPWIWWS